MITSDAALARCQDLVDLARQMGADEADAVARASSSESVSVRLGALEEVERSESEEIGLRVFVGRRSASINTSDFAPEGLRTLAQRAVEMARLAPEDPYGGLVPREALFSGDGPDLDLSDGGEPSPGDLREAALATEDAARAVAKAGGRLVISPGVVAGEGGDKQTDYAYRTQRHRSDLPDPAEIGREAGERAVRKVGPGSIPSAKMPVVFDPRVGGGILGHLLGAMAAPSIARKASFLIGREQDQLFDSALRIVEDPHRLRGLRSRHYDGEGTASVPRALVEEGRITGWLTNVASAAQLDLDLTGHASRGGGGAPGIAPGNVYMEAGGPSVAELIADIEDGVFVTDLFGQGVNLVTGDYSRGASGLRIRNGELAGPVAEITIAGTLPEMFRALVPADDLELQRGIDVPTLRIDGMSVAGQ